MTRCSRELNKAKIDTLLADKEDVLTDWESNFLTSLNNNLSKYDNLTVKQESVLDDIVERVEEREKKARAKD